MSTTGTTPDVTKTESLPSLWRNRDFLLLLGGRTVSHVGSAASGVVFPLLVLDLAKSPVAAGVAGALVYTPYLLLSLPVGALIDRWDRKRVMIWADALRAANMGSVVVALVLGGPALWQLYLNAFIDGVLAVFYGISATAALPRVVPRLQLPDANSMSLGADTVATMAGPPIGTWLYQAVSKAAPFVLDVVSYAASVVSLLFMKRSFQGERTQTRRSLRDEIAEGWHWWWRQPFMRSMAFINSGLNLMEAGLTLLVILLARGAGVPDRSVGLIFTAGALGGLVGALVGPRVQRRLSYGQAVPGILFYQAATLPLMAVAPGPVLLAVAVALMEAAAPAYDVVQYSYRLALIPDELQGRVNSSFRLLAWGSRPLGALIAGFLLEWLGGPATALIYGGFVVALAVAALVNPYIRNAAPLAEVAQQ